MQPRSLSFVPRPIGRFLALAGLPLLLAGCTVAFTVPPRDAAQWTTTTHDVTVHWRYVTPGSLGGMLTSLGHRPDDQTTPRYAGTAITVGNTVQCVVDLDPALSRDRLVHVAAHEYGHCAAGRYNKISLNAEGLSEYHQQLFERYAERYADLYVQECGLSLRPLGWFDLTAPKCAEAPDPRRIRL